MTIRYPAEALADGKIGTARIAKPWKNAAAPAKDSANGERTTLDATQRPAAAAPPHSDLEARMLQQIVVAGLPAPMTQYYFQDNRNWRLDFAWPLMDPPRYVEVQGMAHRIKAKFLADIEKRATLTLAGWVGLEVAGPHVKDGKTAIEWIKQLLK